jgi:hypothetical protein
MLSFEQFYKEVKYYQSITDGRMPTHVRAYVKDNDYQLQLIEGKDFSRYEFSGYTYPQSFYPVISIKK